MIESLHCVHIVHPIDENLVNKFKLLQFIATLCKGVNLFIPDNFNSVS
jgi:hypothetical protein